MRFKTSSGRFRRIRRIKLYNRLYGIMPKRYKNWIEQHLVYSGIGIPPEIYVGFTVLYSISLIYAGVLLVLTRIIPTQYALLFPFSLFITFLMFMHAILIIAADNRTKLVEELLPDMLRLIAANIRSGLTIDKALLVSARPEFGPLEHELKTASKETLSGVTIDTALLKISETFNSKLLKRSVELLSEGLRRGGDLARLLESLSDDIRQIKILKKDVNAMVMMYVIFIFFAAGVGAPLLYSVSGFLVNTMGKIGSSIEIEQSLPMVAGRLPMATPKLGIIDEQFLDTYSLVSLVITAVFGGLLIGLVQEGSERAGLRFIPLLLVISVALYFAAKILINSFFGGIVVA